MIWWTVLAVVFVAAMMYSSLRSHFARAPKRPPALTGPVQGQSWWAVRGTEVAEVAELLGLHDLRQVTDPSDTAREGTVLLWQQGDWVMVLGAPVEDTAALLAQLGAAGEAWGFSALDEPAWCGWAQVRGEVALSAFTLDGDLVEGEGLPTPTSAAVRERAASLGLLANPEAAGERWLAVLPHQ